MACSAHKALLRVSLCFPSESRTVAQFVWIWRTFDILFVKRLLLSVRYSSWLSLVESRRSASLKNFCLMIFDHLLEISETLLQTGDSFPLSLKVCWALVISFSWRFARQFVEGDGLRREDEEGEAGAKDLSLVRSLDSSVRRSSAWPKSALP